MPGSQCSQSRRSCAIFRATPRPIAYAVLAGAVALFSPAVSAQQLKAVTAWDKSLAFNDMFVEWTKRVTQRSGGKLRMDVIGGPEVYPSFEQLEPLKRNVFSAMITSTAYVAGALPEVNATWFGFGATPAQMREAGLVELLDKIAREKAGVTVIGFPLQMRFNVFLAKPIQKAELAGFKLRSTPIYDPVLKGLGAATVTVQPAELLTALESGIVDGFAWPAVMVTGPGYARAIKFKVTPNWWIGTDIVLMNAQAFDALAPEMKKLLVDTMREIERETPAYFEAKEKAEDALLAKANVKNIELSGADLERIKKLHWEEGTKAFLLSRSPKYGQQLKDLMAKFAPK